MEATNELLMKAIIFDNTVSFSNITGDTSVNKICSNGMTPIGAAAQTGNLSILKELLKHQTATNNLPLNTFENRNKPQNLHLENSNNTKKRFKNIGYFVVCRDVEENEFGDGPTPEGMEGLEWDMEVNETQFSTEAEDPMGDDGTINMYKWYANILNRTSVLLQSPERDFGRLDRHGQSVLHYAVNSGNVDMVEYLLESLTRDLSVNQNDACCFSPLHMAAANGDSKMVRWLLKKGANVDAAGGRQRQTALHISARGGHLPVIRMLLDSGADVNAVDVEERSVLTVAVRQCNDEVVRYLVLSGARVNHEEPGGITPLRLAVWANNAAVVQILVDSGARLVHSHHLLHTAASNNNLTIVRSLVGAGTPLNARDDQGYTPLMLACSRKNTPIVRYLLASGADVNASSHIDGKTALHVCVQDVRVSLSIRELIEILVSGGADMNSTCYQGSVLFYSIILGNNHATSALIQHGADVNLRDERAYVDNLSLAKRYGDLQLVKLLVFGGFRLADMSWDPKALRTELKDASCDFLVSVKTNPLNLRELCRIVIRRRLGHNKLIPKIYTLPLPTMLQRYLALEIL